MKRIISILIHLALLNFITLGFNDPMQSVFTVTFMITALTLMYDPIDELLQRRKIRRAKTKKQIEDNMIIAQKKFEKEIAIIEESDYVANPMGLVEIDKKEI